MSSSTCSPTAWGRPSSTLALLWTPTPSATVFPCPSLSCRSGGCEEGVERHSLTCAAVSQYTILSATDGLYHLPPAQSAAIWIVVEGAGSVAPAAGTPEAVATGQVWLQEAGEKAALSTDSRIVFYRAMAGERAA